MGAHLSKANSLVYLPPQVDLPLIPWNWSKSLARTHPTPDPESLLSWLQTEAEAVLQHIPPHALPQASSSDAAARELTNGSSIVQGQASNPPPDTTFAFGRRIPFNVVSGGTKLSVGRSKAASLSGSGAASMVDLSDERVSPPTCSDPPSSRQMPSNPTDRLHGARSTRRTFRRDEHSTAQLHPPHHMDEGLLDRWSQAQRHKLLLESPLTAPTQPSTTIESSQGKRPTPMHGELGVDAYLSDASGISDSSDWSTSTSGASSVSSNGIHDSSLGHIRQHKNGGAAHAHAEQTSGPSTSHTEFRRRRAEMLEQLRARDFFAGASAEDISDSLSVLPSGPVTPATVTAHLVALYNAIMLHGYVLQNVAKEVKPVFCVYNRQQ